MAKDSATIIPEITAFIKKNGGNPRGWFIAQSVNPKRDLKRHGLGGKNSAPYLIRTATTEMQANKVVEHFTERFGVDGSAEDIAKNALYVYCYVKNDKTKP